MLSMVSACCLACLAIARLGAHAAEAHRKSKARPEFCALGRLNLAVNGRPLFVCHDRGLRWQRCCEVNHMKSRLSEGLLGCAAATWITLAGAHHGTMDEQEPHQQ
jgi:hypothetical protein